MTRSSASSLQTVITAKIFNLLQDSRRHTCILEHAFHDLWIGMPQISMNQSYLVQSAWISILVLFVHNKVLKYLELSCPRPLSMCILMVHRMVSRLSPVVIMFNLMSI